MEHTGRGLQGGKWIGETGRVEMDIAEATVLYRDDNLRRILLTITSNDVHICSSRFWN
jgi:hypothetical protein